MEMALALLPNMVGIRRPLEARLSSSFFISPKYLPFSPSRFPTSALLGCVHTVACPMKLLVSPLWLASQVTNVRLSSFLAEFRGPGVHHNFDESDSAYDMEDQKQGKSFGIGGYRGRVIFLGDGTEVLTDSDDAEMFDNSEEDNDLVSQVSKGTSQESGSEEKAADANSSTPPQQQSETKPAGDSKAGEKKNGDA